MTKQEEKTLQWYQEALEVLSPLRYHIGKISEMSSQVLYAKKYSYINKDILAEAEEDLKKVEEFFTKVGEDE